MDQNLWSMRTIVLVLDRQIHIPSIDLDLVREVAGDEIARKVILLTDKAEGLAKK